MSAATAHGAALDAPQAPSWAQDQAQDQETAGIADTGIADTAVGVIPQPSIDSPGMVMGITLGELYTDNLRLAGPGEPKQSSWITEIQPFIKWARSGPRFSGVLDYKLTGYLYAGQSQSNQLAQDLKTFGTFTLVPQHLFIDGSASYGRAIIDNELPSGSGTYFLGNNQANIARGTLSPYWLQDLGKAGTMMLRYSWGRVMYDDHGISGQDAGRLNGISDVTSNGLQFSLVSPEYETWGWNVEYSDQHIEADSGQKIEYATAKLGAFRQISGNSRLLADFGKENRFLPDGTSRKLGANFWDVGFDWSNSRSHLKLLVGHRFYGRSYQFSWSRTAALLTTAVSYVEQPTDLNQQLLGQNPAQVITSPVGVPGIPSLLERRTYLMKRATASATYTMPTSRLHLSLYNERRRYFLLDNREEKVTNGDISWQFDIGPFTTITPRLGWQRYKFQDGQTSYNRYSQLEFVHQVNPKNFGSLRLRRNSRNVYSGVPGAHGYGVNVVFVQWTHLF